MRRSFAVAVGIGALTAVSMALVVPTGAGAQTSTTTTSTTAPPTLIETVCGNLPDLIDAVTAALPQADTALTAARTTMDTRRTAMTTAMTELATAVVNHLAVLDAGGNPTATGLILNGKQAQYVDAVVAWSKARTQVFDGEQLLVFGQLQETLLDSVNDSACP
jgi:hypothetical protein